ncbi:MAG: helix-turn-helix domain-containing protein [Deltaproteobacteria bacterium]|nr:helix-turn-helix domain-containing protein [Deltaproteobacteria bacterium]
MLTPEEAAHLLKLPRKTVVALCARGDIPGARKVGRQWRVPRWALAAMFRRSDDGQQTEEYRDVDPLQGQGQPRTSGVGGGDPVPAPRTEHSEGVRGARLEGGGEDLRGREALGVGARRRSTTSKRRAAILGLLRQPLPPKR